MNDLLLAQCDPKAPLMDAETRARVLAALPGWLGQADLDYFAGEFGRAGFRGGLNWYRVRTTGLIEREYAAFTGRTIDQPSTFISGASDWGNYQSPDALERMQKSACTDMKEIHLIPGAGHWVQQEQPARVTELLLELLRVQP